MKNYIQLALILFLGITLNTQGQPYFIKHYGDVVQDESYGLSVNNDRIMQVGYTYGHYFIPGDVYLVNTNLIGQLNNAYNIDFNGTDCAYGITYNVNGDRYAIVGYTTEFDSINPKDSICGRDVFLMQTDKNGIPNWAKRYGFNGAEDVAKSVIVTSDNCYLIVGYTSFQCDSDTANCSLHNILMIKTDFNGNLLWSKSIGINNRDDYAMKVIEVAGTNYYLTGYTDDLSGDIEPFLMKTTTNGTVNWVSLYGDPNAEDEAFSLVEADNGITVVGHTFGFGSGGSSDVFAFHTAYNGSVLWKASYPTYSNSQSSFGRDIINYKKRYLIGGYADEISAAPNYDFNYILTDLQGNMQVESNFGGDNDDRAYSIALLGKDVVLSGYSYTWTNGVNDVALVDCNHLGQVDNCYYWDPVGNPFYDTTYKFVHFSDCDYIFSDTLRFHYSQFGHEEIVCGSDSDSTRVNRIASGFAMEQVSIHGNNDIKININSEFEENITIDVFNSIGKKIKCMSMQLLIGRNDLMIPLTDDTRGLVIINAYGKQISTSRKLMVLD